MSIYILFIVFLLFFILNKNIIEKYSDLWDSDKSKRNIKTFTDGLFKVVKAVAEGFVLAFDSKTPGKKPCSNWDSRYRDDGASCWLDSYGRGGGRIPDVSCPSNLPNKQGIGAAAWCDNGPRADFWNLKTGSANITCNSDEERNGGLCYPKCKSGYHPVGCCICEPDEGAGIKVTAFDRYDCPPPGNSDYVNLHLALCYRDLPSVQGQKRIQNSNGQSIKCNSDVDGGGGEDAVYRVENGNLRMYPNERIASSWDSNWRNAKMISDCSGVKRLDDMSYKSEVQLKDANANNRSVVCGKDVANGAGPGAVYRAENNQLRWYPTSSIASSWDQNWNNPITVDDCTITSRGTDMKLKEPNLRNGRLGWQGDGDNDGGGGLSWNAFGSWNKYYKVSCKDNTGNESNIKGPYGPVNFLSYKYPLIRVADDNQQACSGDSKVTIYRSDSKDGVYVDISDDPKLFNRTNNGRYNRKDPVFSDDVDIPYVYPPNLKNDTIYWQRNDYDSDKIWWMQYSNGPWNKYYKISCKNELNNQSDIKGPFGPVTGQYQGLNFYYPNIRLSDDNISPCGNNKVSVYRSNSRDSGYVDISDHPNLFNRANNGRYNRKDPVFTDDVPP